MIAISTPSWCCRIPGTNAIYPDRIRLTTANPVGAPTRFDNDRGSYVKKMFVGGLPLESTEETVTEMFAEFGKVRSIKLAADVFSGKCKGFGFVEMEGHEARAAIAGLNGKIVGDKSLKVQFEEPRKARGGRGRR